MQCQMPQEVIDSQNEKEICNLLKSNGLILAAPKEVKLYLLSK